MGLRISALNVYFCGTENLSSGCGFLWNWEYQLYLLFFRGTENLSSCLGYLWNWESQLWLWISVELRISALNVFFIVELWISALAVDFCGTENISTKCVFLWYWESQLWLWISVELRISALVLDFCCTENLSSAQKARERPLFTPQQFRQISWERVPLSWMQVYTLLEICCIQHGCFLDLLLKFNWYFNTKAWRWKVSELYNIFNSAGRWCGF